VVSAEIPRIVVAGTASGVGKTTVATGLLAALHARGGRPAGFKVGPDYIDPSYHALATGRPGRNLDAFLSGTALLGPLLAHGARDADVAVIEGVMGLFDGRSGSGELASTAEAAKQLDASVLLVLDASGMARSVAAAVHGYATFDPELRVAGVVLNRVGSDWHEELLREALAPLGLPVLGAIRRTEGLVTPERHLGLVPAVERRAHAERSIAALGEAVAHSLDLDAVLELARSAGPLAGAPWSPAEAIAAADGAGAAPVRVAVGRGPAFSFLYPENLELLEAGGAEIVPFDPAADPDLPEGTDALYLGGGFPEVYVDELAENAALRRAIAALARSGRPVVGECGGMMYLSRELDGRPMCGVIDATTRMTEQLSLGYREAEAVADSPLLPRGGRLRGHEHHYSTTAPAAGPVPAWTLRARGRERTEGFAAGNVYASYLHMHWAAAPEVPRRLVARARAAREPADAPISTAAPA
jgi:cobyrinic acid a,c-diamide synthase